MVILRKIRFLRRSMIILEKHYDNFWNFIEGLWLTTKLVTFALSLTKSGKESIKY